jgi:hypothetical protein
MSDQLNANTGGDNSLLSPAIQGLTQGEKLPDSQGADPPRSGLPDQIADLSKLWPIGRQMVELGDKDNNAHGVLSGLVLKGEILVRSDQTIEKRGRFPNQRTVLEPPPTHFRDALHLVAGKGQSKARVYALVKADAHSLICSPASSRKLGPVLVPGTAQFPQTHPARSPL